MNIIDAMERIEEAKTNHVRGMHDSTMKGLTPIRRDRVIYLDSSATARAVRFFLRLARLIRR